MLESNYPLKHLNTFGIDAHTRWFARVHNQDELLSVLSDPRCKTLPKYPLGGGSNTLFTKDYEGLIIKTDFPGMETINEDQQNVWVRCGAGIVWHDFVMHCVSQNWGGVENMALIPGNVGAAPMQNIGAYGVEIKSVVDEVSAWLPDERRIRVFKNDECTFGYRSSVFKTHLRGKAYILNVTFKLQKNPVFNTTYGAINEELARMHVTQPGIREVSDAVMAIRRSKLPDPNVIGNAGSFFKNPVISQNQCDALLSKYSDLPYYAAGTREAKVPAGWLIEKAGWKGETFFGRYGIHTKQALVLVNYGGATGREIYDLSTTIIKDIEDRFGITLEREVNIL